MAAAAHAQQWPVNNAINNQIVETAIFGGAQMGQASASTPRAVAPTATRFTPVAGDDAVKQLADSLGNTPEERQQILQLADAGKQMFALKYKGKWNNTVTGAMTFFIASVVTVQTDGSRMPMRSSPRSTRSTRPCRSRTSSAPRTRTRPRCTTRGSLRRAEARWLL